MELLSVSRVSKREIHGEWKIHDFRSFPLDIGRFIKSSTFSLSDLKWHIIVYPNGGHELFDGWIGLCLVLEDSAAEHRVAFKIGMINGDYTERKVFEDEKVFKKSTDMWGIGKFVERSDVVQSYSMYVFCEIRIVPDMLLSSTTEAATQTLFANNDIPSLSNDLKDLYLSKRCTDVTITVKGREFLAHKNILLARSEVFASMFKYDTAEKNSGNIEISDCNPDTFNEFLLFLYTGKMEMVTSSNSTSLYRTADKYDVQKLKEECICCMTHELTVDSFCDVLHLATMYNESELMKAATNFFKFNTKAILMNTKWHTFISENPLLGNELLLKLYD